MQSLNQGIEFKDKKIQYGGLVKSVNTKKDLQEGFQGIQEGLEQRISQFNDQIIDFHGSIKGDSDRTREMTLAAAMGMVKTSNEYYGFEYQKKTKKVIFRTYKKGLLPKNSGKLPSLKFQKGWTTYLKVNNGMPESQISEISEGNAIERAQSKERREMQVLENEYNLLLGQYRSTYKRYLDEVVSKTAATNTTMSNQVRQSSNGRHHFISGTGIAREFDPNSWNKRDQSSCPSSSGSISDAQLNALVKGTNMGQGEACRGGGYVAKSDNGTMAWVSPEGTSHIFKDYLNKNDTCPDSFTKITNKQFDAVPKGTPYGAQDTCEIIQLNTGSGRAVIAMNEKLKSLADKMKDLVVNSDHNADKVSDKKKDIKKGMRSTITQLREKRREINGLRQNIATSQATAKQQIISAEQLQLKYFAWTLAGLTLGMMAFRQIRQAQ
tara:strand:- start:321 stop:1631 length:1311 start_codon:yes stop_codon:yes gene_type:complete